MSKFDDAIQYAYTTLHKELKLKYKHNFDSLHFVFNKLHFELSKNRRYCYNESDQLSVTFDDVATKLIFEGDNFDYEIEGAEADQVYRRMIELTEDYGKKLTCRSLL